MNLEKFITKYIPLSTHIIVCTNIDNEQLFEGEARELYDGRYDDDETFFNILHRDVAEIEPDYNYAGWLIIAVD